MAKSLQEQLLQAGVVDKERATKLKKAKHKEGRKRLRGAAETDETKAAAERARTEKAARDRVLSQQQQAAAAEKAVAAQVRQLIEKNRIEGEAGEIPYNFSDQNVIRKMYVSESQQTALVDGRIAVARLDGSYVLVPAPVATKVRERDPGAVLVLNIAGDGVVDADDEYADYQIPDDLTW